MLLSSVSEICLRVMNGCSPSVRLHCLLCLSTSPSLLETHTWTHTVSTATHLAEPANLQQRTEAASHTALWVGATGWFWSRDWRRKSVRGCPAAPPSLLAEQAAVGSAWGQTCPRPKAPIQAAKHTKTARGFINGAKNWNLFFFFQLLQLCLFLSSK